MLETLEGASTAMESHERMMRILDAGTKHLDLLFVVGSGVSKVSAEGWHTTSHLTHVAA